MKGSKYGSAKTMHAGRSFASKLEASTYDVLCLMEKAGEISQITQQETVYLTLARIAYIADFTFQDHKLNHKCWAESKGYATPEWKLKKRLWKCYGPGPLYIWTGHYSRPTLTETIIPVDREEPAA